MKTHLRLILPLLTVSALFVGCSPRNSLKLPEIPNPLADKKPQKSIPIRDIVCVWKHAEGPNGRGSQTRGVAGQIIFFTYGSETPVKIDDDSEVVIYMFDDQGTPEEQSKPIASIQFIDKTWNRHLGKGQLGPTYQVFIPYNRKTVHQVKVTLSVRVLAKDRQPISSKADTITLFGPIRENSTFTRNIESGVNPGQTQVSTFGARSKEEAFANLGKKIDLVSRNATMNSTSDAAADALLRRHGIASRQPPAGSVVRQASGHQPFASRAVADRLPVRNENPYNRGTEPRGFPQTADRVSNPLPGTGIQLKPAAGAATASHHQSFEQERQDDGRREPPNASRHPLGEVRRPTRPTAMPTGNNVSTRHPLEAGKNEFRTEQRRPFAEAEQYRHPLKGNAIPSRRFFPKANAWDAGDEYNAPTTTPRSLDDRRAEIQKSFGADRFEHPLGQQERGAAKPARTRHPLADDFESGGAFR